LATALLHLFVNHFCVHKKEFSDYGQSTEPLLAVSSLCASYQSAGNPSPEGFSASTRLPVYLVGFDYGNGAAKDSVAGKGQGGADKRLYQRFTERPRSHNSKAR
jgi:hypothetical protein